MSSPSNQQQETSQPPAVSPAENTDEGPAASGAECSAADAPVDQATSKTPPLVGGDDTSEAVREERQESTAADAAPSLTEGEMDEAGTSETPPLTTAAETANGEGEAADVVAEMEESSTVQGPSLTGAGGEGPVSPSMSQPSTTADMNSSLLADNDGSTTDEQMDFSDLLHQTEDHGGPMGLSSHIEIHPTNDTLGSSRQKFIKRPLNAYMIWTRQERKRILSGDPKLKMNEVSKAIKMGERWKAMTDVQKKPYFELARKWALEHKQALQEHPELTYAPSKKKGPKAGPTLVDPPKPGGGGAHSHHQQQSQPAKNHHGASVTQQGSSSSFATTPDPSPRSTTPRQSSILPPQNSMFFQSPLSSGVQIAQVLGVRPGAQLMANPAWTQVQQGMQATPPATPVSGSLLVGQQHQQGAFMQPQQLQQRLAANPLGSVQQLAAAGNMPRGVTVGATPGQMLDLYYTSLCQPAFPSITESPVNTLSMYPPSYLLEQYNQHFQQQQSGSGGGGAGGGGTGGPF